MAEVAKWRFYLANSKDLSNVGELTQARDRNLTVIHNGPGTASFRLPMDDPLAESIWPHSSAIKTYRVSPSGIILPWSGSVATIDEDPPNNMMTVNCVGWLGRFENRYLRREKVYNAIDDGAIIQDLIADLNLATLPDGYVPTIPAGSSPNTSTWIQWGGTLPNEGSGGATAYVTQARNKTYAKWQNVGRAINDLTQIENGCDVWVHPATRALYVYRKRRRVLTSVVFGYKWGPSNVANFGRKLDGSTVTNYHLTTGQANLGGVYAHDLASQGAYNLLEENMNLPDIGDQAILGAFSAAEVAVRAQPRSLYSVTPFGWTSENGVPEPFVDYDVGDQVKLVAVHLPRININQQVRIFGINVSIDPEGNEKLGELQLSP